jgi:AcrR family transcriptional regulator
MDGRKKRTQRIIERIKESALELFSSHGVEKVSVDEIARKATVSKVTIYKHFHSKEELHREVINLYSNRVIAAAEEILASDLDFLEKLRLLMMAQINKPQMASNTYLIEMLEQDAQAEGRLNERLKNIIFRFFEAGKQQGYIEESLPFEILYLHSEIYRAGFKAKLTDAESVLTNREATEKMTNLYFFGIIKRN